MKKIYCTIPKQMVTKKADPFAYKLRSMEEV
jgi:hypothetical protein